MVYSKSTVYDGKWVWYLRSLAYFHIFEALNNAFEVQFFSGLHFYTLSQTLIACRTMQLRFLKVETSYDQNNQLRFIDTDVYLTNAQNDEVDEKHMSLWLFVHIFLSVY